MLQLNPPVAPPGWPAALAADHATAFVASDRSVEVFALEELYRPRTRWTHSWPLDPLRLGGGPPQHLALGAAALVVAGAAATLVLSRADGRLLRTLPAYGALAAAGAELYVVAPCASVVEVLALPHGALLRQFDLRSAVRCLAVRGAYLEVLCDRAWLTLDRRTGARVGEEAALQVTLPQGIAAVGDGRQRVRVRWHALARTQLLASCR